MEKQDKGTWVWIAVIAVILAMRFYGGGLPSLIAPQKVTSVTYVHDEKAAIPSGVLAAINELNSRPGIVASNFPDDATDDEGQVPDQYKVTLPAARSAGVPSLVVQAGDKVLVVIKSPTTKQQVLEAVP